MIHVHGNEGSGVRSCASEIHRLGCIADGNEIDGRNVRLKRSEDVFARSCLEVDSGSE